MTRTQDLTERATWTAISTLIGALLATPILIHTLETATNVNLHITPLGALALAATTAGLATVANIVLVIARWRLPFLRDPGTGLPGLPTAGHDTG